MSDELVTGHLPDLGLRLVAATTTELSRAAAIAHEAQRGSASMLAQALTSAALLTGLHLQKGVGRINLQLECDGPLRGLFAESLPDGSLRGYVKNPLLGLDVQQDPAAQRALLGNQGFLSVLRESPDQEVFRSSVELERFFLEGDLGHFFEVSEQVPTAILLRSDLEAKTPLVAGALVQLLPDGDAAALGELADAWRSKRDLSASSATKLLGELSPPSLEITSRTPLAFRCPCSKARVLRALLTLGQAELRDVLEKEGRADATCHFCNSHYEVSADELRALLEQLG